MAILKLDPPPETDDIRAFRAWANDLYEQVDFVLKNIGEENLDSDFISRINNIGTGGNGDEV